MSVTPEFLLRQKVWDAFSDIRRYAREHEMIVAAHPDDLTDELRGLIAAAPLTTLRESRLVGRGTLFVIHPGLLADLEGPTS